MGPLQLRMLGKPGVRSSEKDSKGKLHDCCYSFLATKTGIEISSRKSVKILFSELELRGTDVLGACHEQGRFEGSWRDDMFGWMGPWRAWGQECMSYQRIVLINLDAALCWL